MGTLPVTRPTLGGLRIARNSRTSNAEAHAVYVYTPTLDALPKRQTPMRAVQYTPIDIYCCHVLDYSRKLRSFQVSSTKRQVNASLIYNPPPAACAASAVGLCKDKINSVNGKIKAAIYLLSHINKWHRQVAMKRRKPLYA